MIFIDNVDEEDDDGTLARFIILDVDSEMDPFRDRLPNLMQRAMEVNTWLSCVLCYLDGLIVFLNFPGDCGHFYNIYPF